MAMAYRALAATVVASAALLGGCAGMGAGPTKERVVLQVSDGDTKTWNQALNVVRNLKTNYTARGVESEIQLVAFGHGIGMLKDDAVVAGRVRDAMKGGAQMVACENTMRGFKLSKDMMLDSVVYTETGVIYIIEKQREGWAVIRP